MKSNGDELKSSHLLLLLLLLSFCSSFSMKVEREKRL
jgi:hypothetical protein